MFDNTMLYFRAALELTDVGWAQKVYIDHRGCKCLLKAIADMIDDGVIEDHIIEELYTGIFGVKGSRLSIPEKWRLIMHWNDARERTLTDVIELLAKLSGYDINLWTEDESYDPTDMDIQWSFLIGRSLDEEEEEVDDDLTNSYEWVVADAA